MVARAELLSRPSTPSEPAPKPDGKKRAKGTGADAKAEAKPAQARSERGSAKNQRRGGPGAPEAEQDAAQDNEAETEDTE